ncbi:cation:proton antiporter [Maritalea sp.]|uniref:cation:proton antiporter n=1 Tax=Maritalea sp. TaxID=2003361 RepID=UPI003EF49350
MTEYLPLVIISAVLMGFALVAKSVTRSMITAPMVALFFGCVLSSFDVAPAGITEAHLHTVAEFALVVLLFLDAAKINVAGLIERHTWPARTLLIGMPLALLGGAIVNFALLPEWPLPVILLLAAIMVPTDAALGQSVVESKDVPERLRRAIIVESGLNDGIALPVILTFAAFAAASSSAPSMGWPLYGLMQITIGPLVGAVMGLVVGRAFLLAQAKGTSSQRFEGIAVLALAFCAYLSATMIGGNGFISAFACGISFGWVVEKRCSFIFEFSENEGQLLSWTAFFLIGALLFPEAIRALDAPMLAAILLSLIVVRPFAVAVALARTDADLKTRVFIGWFGPRGLATALFALLVAEELAPETAIYVVHFATNAVWISAILHGTTTGPFIKALGK